MSFFVYNGYDDDYRLNEFRTEGEADNFRIEFWRDLPASASEIEFKVIKGREQSLQKSEV
jgi:hypothetical protein